LNVAPGTGYVAGAPNNATVTIDANGFVVVNTNDAGQGSLRQAVLNANAIAGPDIVTFGGSVFTDATVPDEIALSSGQIALGSGTTIQGPGANVLTVRNTAAPAGSSRVFTTTLGASNMVLEGMTISGGNPNGGVSGSGGGILVNSSSSVTVRSCTIKDNFAETLGAGIRVVSTGSATIENCTISNNAVTTGTNGGGGVDSLGTLVVINSTISGNSVPIAGTSGGGILSGGTTTLHNCTITNNSAAGAASAGGVLQTGGTLTVSSSIIAKNNVAGNGQDVGGSFVTSGFNLIGDNTGSNFVAGLPNANSEWVGTSAARLDPLLGPLADNGGTTPTHALLAGSPALNTGSNPLALTTDQRGAGFNRSIGNPDIGAFELQKSVGIVALNATQAEGTGAGPTAFTFTVSRLGDTVGPVTVDYAVTGTSAAPANGTDFQGGALPTGQVTIADTQTSTTLTINVAKDVTVEPNEEFTVTLTNPNNGYAINGGTATGTINNDDTTTVTLAGGTALAEGNAGTTSFGFTVTSSNPVQGGFTIAYTTNDGTATTADLDYADNDNTLNFTSTSAGEVQNVAVLVTGDNKVEANEAFTVALGAITNTTLGASITPAGSPQTGTINNDDSAVVALAGNVSQSEALTPQAFSVTLSNPVDVAVTVNFSTSDDSALVADNDYTGITNQVVTFAAGTTTAQTVNVTVTNDGNVENNEAYNVNLGGLNDGGRSTVTLGTSAGTGTIVDDDVLTVNIVANDASADENTGDTGSFVISRNTVLGSTTVPFSIPLVVSPNPSGSNDDFGLSGGSVSYTNLGPGNVGTVVIPAGQSSVQVTLTPVNDIHAEPAEVLRLDLATNFVPYTVGPNGNATITVAANDAVVINTNDSGEGSLRQAALNANDIAGLEIVTFEGSVFTDATPDVISLTSGAIPVGLFTEINGTGARMLTVANAAAPSPTSRVFNVTGGSAGAFLRDMTITGGNPNNTGGGGVLVNAGAAVTIERCTINGNTTTARGAGIQILSGGAATVTDSTISNNFSAGTACGGGIDNVGGTLTVTQSTISGNGVTVSGASGGGVFTSGASTTQINNCTITNNSATGAGSAGGVKQAGGLITVTSTLIAKNAPTAASPDVAGTFLSPSYNLIGNNTGSTFAAGTPSGTNWVGSSATPLDPLLNPVLADNGGPTDTHLLQNGSPALDRGTNLLFLPLDQRGTGFPRQLGVSVDIGAVEALIFTPAVTSATTNEDTLSAPGSGLVITNNAADNGLTTHFKITNFVNGTVFKFDGSPVPVSGFITLAEGAEGLRFLPDSNENTGNTPAGFHFDVQASTSASDAGLKPEVVTASITVNAVNDPPTVVPPGIPDQTLVILQAVNINLLPHFQDVDLHTLSFTVFSNSAPAVASASINANGTSVDVMGLGVGSTQVTIRADDGNGGSITDTFAVQVGVPKPGMVIKTNKVLNAQTGLFEMKVEVTNNTAVNLFGFRLRVTNLPSSLKLYNATSTPGSPDVFVEHAYPMAIGDKVTLTLQFFSPTRTWPAGYVPTFDVEGLTSLLPTVVSPTGVRITRLVELADGSILIEWPAVIGRWYQVQFSDDNVTWKRSLVLIKATATRVQWIDRGPPFTDVHPSTVASRFYRVQQIIP
jgi:hypothetical protein